MGKIKLRAFVVVLLLIVSLLALILHGWLLIMLGVVSLAVSVIYLIAVLEDNQDMTIEEFFIGEE